MKVKISIIVPVYNAEKYLHRCIDSILAQTFADFELLLVNDGSKDNSGTICEEYAAKDARVRVFHKENGGASSARNLGLENANGQWITFCDSDDFVDKDWLENYIDNSSGECDLVVQTIKILNQGYDEINGPQQSIQGDGKKMMVSLKYNGGTLGYPVNKLFSSKIIKDNNLKFREDFKLREDEDFVLRYLLYVNNGRIIKDGGYNYIIPDYHNKYSSIDVFDIEIELYNTAWLISEGQNNSGLDCYQIELTLQLMAKVFAGNYTHIKPFVKTIGFKVFRWISIKAITRKIYDFLRKF